MEKTADAGILMPAQYADLVRRNHTLEGELKLLMAVLEDAIRCYLRNVDAKDGERKREFIEVRNWFEAPSQGRRESSASRIFARRSESSRIACSRA